MAPYALSIHHFVSSVGADAGFAAIIGLAILVLLYFAHARETSALRQQAATLAERLEDAEARLAEAERSGIPIIASRGTPVAGAAPSAAASPATVAAGVRGGAGAVESGTPPAAPAGVGAPALAAATRFIPVAAAGVPEAAAAAVPAAQTAGAQAMQTAGAPRAPAPAPQPTPAASPLPTAVPEPRPFAPAAATVAGAANGATHTEARPAPEARPVAAAASRADYPSRAPAGRLPTRPGAPTGGDQPPYGSFAPAPRRRTSVSRVVMALVVLLVLAGAIVALVIATASSGTQNSPAAGRTTNAPSAKHHGAGFNPATVTVAVLNGTGVNHLAERISSRLASQGYKPGTNANASDQTLTSTTVSYLPGYRTAAMHVAASLGLGASTVKQIDPNTRQVACQGAATCTANVVVTAGANLSNG